jgi:hypothetical protein
MISKITIIVMVVVVVILPIMILGTQTAFADNDQPTSLFKINVVLDVVDSKTGVIKVFISSEDDAYQERIINPFKHGRVGVVDLDDFVFSAIHSTSAK